jgi:thiol-disulfide isomerase/thioredoxin
MAVRWICSVILYASVALAPVVVFGQSDLRLKDLSGSERSLSEYRGQVVVLNFWATWCIPCRAEMPILVLLQERYSGRGVQFIGASADEGNSREKVIEFVRRLKINFPILLGATSADMQRFNLGDALPATAIIDRDGRVVSRIIGPAEHSELEARIEWLLGDRSSPPPPELINKFEGHREDHSHEGIGIEGASVVPS